jgi:hypothetical protein
MNYLNHCHGFSFCLVSSLVSRTHFHYYCTYCHEQTDCQTVWYPALHHYLHLPLLTTRHFRFFYVLVSQAILFARFLFLIAGYILWKEDLMALAGNKLTAFVFPSTLGLEPFHKAQESILIFFSSSKFTNHQAEKAVRRVENCLELQKPRHYFSLLSSLV